MEHIAIAQLLEAEKSTHQRAQHADYSRHTLLALEAAERSRRRRAAWNGARIHLAALVHEVARAIEPRSPIDTCQASRRPV